MENEQYDVISASNIDELIDYVNRCLADGWKLNGGVSATVRINPNYEVAYGYYQAMSKIVNK